MQRGANQRAVGSTRLNEISSRSHAVFMIITENVTVEGVDEDTALIKFHLAPLMA